MDHREALRLQAAEKYILGELSPEVREQFEEHYFDCPECARGLKTLGAFLAASRKVLKEDDLSLQDSFHEPKTQRAGWFNWLQPVIAVPAIMVLAVFIVYQVTVTIPSAKKQAAIQSVAEVYVSSYHLQGMTRGADVAKLAVSPGESFALDFDFTPAQEFPNYQGSLVDSSGQAVLVFFLKGDQTNKEVHVVIPGGKVRAGKYDLVVVGGLAKLDQASKANEVLRLSFVVASGPETNRSGERPATKE